ncbi:sugar phosphate nucleotidyltransferase [Cellvibrio sp. PSBB023]|uniref:sugar phosphate nucleotidyltransferase n=1 Tax=Cellvibrio sp. PSBB023 TaxID=1945512 RepID=UPI00098EDB4C|nr:sugar phosphate nucleotidyltransferase [Cellvibrio sp. PSBB023]AQT61388.1 hypothetical protein B0D95_15690 [Cellvibrio sp. PSBB023]
MQIVIPMSGFGERFRRAGYSVPKPLIEIDGKPIIAHVIDMFPGEQDFLFICNQDHLDEPSYKMESILKHYCPTGRIIGIPSHKLGPIHAVRQVSHLIDPIKPVIVNYCDFTCYWDWNHFKSFVKSTSCKGSIPAYKGFHPHTLGSTNYAYMREENGWVLDIQEKQPYTNNRMEEYASSGTYYFDSGNTMNTAFHETMNQGYQVGGEYYVSLAYKPMLAAGEKVTVYPLQHFMQWGTPADVEEYNGWSNAFKKLASTQKESIEPNGTIIIPMAGLGQRFVNEGYELTKPLISVSGMPMVIQAASDLPLSKQYVFVLRKDMLGVDQIIEKLKDTYPNAVIETIVSVTEGQACTALIGLEALEKNAPQVSKPITIGACDNGTIYDKRAFNLLASNPEVDVIVWGVRRNANAIRRPTMFGWIKEQNGTISEISVKTPLANPVNDPIVLGTFTFRNADIFHRVVKNLIDRDGRVNGEFYLDSCINDAIELGFNCQLFEVEHYLSWGTPNDLRTFEYWQSCFHKWSSHPYQLDLDRNIPQNP